MSLTPPEEFGAPTDAPEGESSRGDADVVAEDGQARSGRTRRRRSRRPSSTEHAEAPSAGQDDEYAVAPDDQEVAPSVDATSGAATPTARVPHAPPEPETTASVVPPSRDQPSSAAPIVPAGARDAQHHNRQGAPTQTRSHQGSRPAPSHQPFRQRPNTLPSGVPSAAALDEQEPPRASLAPRQEPSGDLALLLRGFEEIQQKNTDRLLSAMRQTLSGNDAGSAARSVNVLERLGVFVDVPNLVYAARYLNRWIDFSRLLDRLVAGRRLVRAQAYSPTDPDPAAEQQFLAPVKSQGFRLTTKNYRTFASGAKKADMDLDLCMDVVRMVVAKAVDCVVLCSGDGDFMPMVQFCSDNGVRVEVASFIEATSDELRQGCDRFYNLSAMDGIRLSRPLANG